MVRHRGRNMLGAVSGLLWGLGTAVIVQQLGWRPLDPLLLYGVPAVAIVLSLLWARRGRGSTTTAAMVVLLTSGGVLAQGDTCRAFIGGFDDGERELTASSIGNPVEIPEDFEEIEVFVEVGGAGDGEVWVELGGFRVPVGSQFVEDDLYDVLTRDDLGPFTAPGLYHIGGSVTGVCTGEGYIRIGGGPIDNPIGRAAIGAVVVGLLGTWFAGRKPPIPPDVSPESAPEKRATPEREPAVIGSGGPLLRPPRMHAALFDELTGVSLSGWAAGTSHRIEVRLGGADPEWAGAAVPVGTAPRDVQIVLTEPRLLPVPRVAVVRQAGAAASGPAAFHLEVPAGATTVDARLIALHENRILHTVRLPGRVGGAETPAEPAAPDVTTAETTVQATRRVGPARAIDAALLVNHSDGEPRLTGVAGDAAAVIDVGEGDVAESVEKIRRRLGEVVIQPEEFSALEDGGTIELLVFLAHHGRLLRNALVGDFLDGRLATAGALQMVSATPDAYFPLEFAYDFPAPAEDASLCPSAVASLRDPDPTAPCPAEHHPGVVCPLGFWGLSRVIERHSHQPGEALPAGFLLRSTPRPDRGTIAPGSIVFAASDRVDAVATGTLASLSAGLAALATGAVEARKWEEWIADVAAGPALTIVLPHTVYSDTLDTYGLEIGTADRRWAGDIDARFVPPEERPVITILLGCETAAAGRVSFERFPGLFRRAGAEVVFGTLTEILGRHAAPVASALAAEIAGGWHAEPMQFGEVALRLRRRLLADGIVAVLALVAFGDADWGLGGAAAGSPSGE